MRSRPLGIVILSVLTLIAGLSSFIFNFGLYGIVWGVVAILFAWGLWQLKSWAWLGALIWIGVDLVWAVIALIGPGDFKFVGAILSLAIVLYLLQPRVRAAFARPSP